MRIPFDIKFRPQIESGEYKVETNFGSPVEIVCWNRRDDTANKAIVGIIRDGTVEEIAAWNIFGKLCDAAFPQNPAYDLFIVTPEPEMTDFEKKLWEVLKSEYSPIGPIEKFTNADKEVFHSYVAELLALARKQLQPELDAEIEKAYKTADEVMYRKGKEDGIAEARNDITARIVALKQAKDRAEEALKNLPRWKKISENGRNYSDSPQFVINGRYLEMNDTLNDVYEIALSDLEKLQRRTKNEI